MCHQKNECSFQLYGKKFLVCSRCTGIIIGFLISLPLSFFIKNTIILSVALMIPLIFDGILQLKSRYTSTNAVRLVTGISFGFGMVYLYANLILRLIRIGYKIASLVNLI
ncbi:DUF2085 domain-containing protein [Mycoplasmatota bacterium]|nr:DUF2085 domain-containing protein [Mycoplasmatota bacterium]